MGEDFAKICESLGQDLRLWERICKDLQDFGRGFTRICETLGEDLQVFMRLWESIHKDT